jgi:prophage regulatory protein
MNDSADNAKPNVSVERHERPIRMLRLQQVMAMTGLGKTSIYELQARRDFPQSVPLTSTAVAWIEHEVQGWLEKRITLRSRCGKSARL